MIDGQMHALGGHDLRNGFVYLSRLFRCVNGDRYGVRIRFIIEGAAYLTIAEIISRAASASRRTR